MPSTTFARGLWVVVGCWALAACSVTPQSPQADKPSERGALQQLPLHFSAKDTAQWDKVVLPGKTIFSHCDLSLALKCKGNCCKGGGIGAEDACCVGVITAQPDKPQRRLTTDNNAAGVDAEVRFIMLLFSI